MSGRDASTRSRWRSALIEPLVTVALATVLFFLGFGGLRSLMTGALNTGDMLMAYVANAMSSDGAFYGNNRFGYPLGMDLRYFPTADHLLNVIASVIGAASHNPILGVNAMWALSFPLTALAALWLMRLLGLRGPLAIFGALVVTFIPYHWLRSVHVYLGTMYSAVLAVCLALFIGSGQMEAAWRSRHRRRMVVLVVLLCAVMATSGIYYAAFAAILATVAVLWRWARGARWRALALDVAPIIVMLGFVAAVLFPAWWFLHTTPSYVPLTNRIPWESIAYSGALSYVLLPNTGSLVPGFGLLKPYLNRVLTDSTVGPTSGVPWAADSGSLLTTAALLFGVIGTMWLARRQRRGRPDEPIAEGVVGPGLVATLTGVAVLFFVPWGLNYMFAVAVTAEIRAWDRMTPVLLTLFVSLAAVTARRMKAPERGWPVFAGVTIGIVVLVLDGVWPYRAPTVSAANAARSEQAIGVQYAAALNAAIPGKCGVLQLPYVAYPESAPVNALGAYDHAWPALTNTDKMWSFGASRETFDAAWMERLAGTPDKAALRDLAAGGFCAVHVDLRGYSAADGAAVVSTLTSELGKPVANGRSGQWLAFAIPGWSAPISERDLNSLPSDVEDFYDPLHVTAGSGINKVADGTGWSITLPTAQLTLGTGNTDVSFGSVYIPVSAPACASRDITVTVTTPAGTERGSVHLDSGASGSVSINVQDKVSTARVSVSADGPRCSVDGADAYAVLGHPSRVAATG